MSCNVNHKSGLVTSNVNHKPGLITPVLISGLRTFFSSKRFHIENRVEILEKHCSTHSHSDHKIANLRIAPKREDIHSEGKREGSWARRPGTRRRRPGRTRSSRPSRPPSTPSPPSCICVFLS